MNTSVIFEDRQNNKLLINLLEVESVKVEIANMMQLLLKDKS